MVDRTVLCERSLARFAQHTKFSAPIVPKDWVNQHALFNAPVSHVSTQLDNLPHTVAASDAGQGHVNARHASAAKDIKIVQRTRLDLQDNPTWLYFWVWKISILEHTQIAMLFKKDGFHKVIVSGVEGTIIGEKGGYE